MIEPATFNMPRISREWKGSVTQKGFFFFFLWQILKNCNSQQISRKDEPSLHPWLFCPARIKSTAACSSNSGHLRWRTLSWPVEKKISDSWKKKKSTCLNHAVYFPHKPELCLNTRVGFATLVPSDAFITVVNFICLKMCRFSHLWQTPTAEHHS